MYWLQAKEKLFTDHRQCVLDNLDNVKHRIFIDRDSDILFVAHLDTVLPAKLVKSRKTKSGKTKRIYAHGLDDRLGCCIAAVLSKSLGVDLLLTDHEESCGSTAQYHELKDYNWIAEFDREGQDVVTYDIDNTEFRTALSELWKIGIGSYSDICSLQTSACCVNIGMGHQFSHSKDSYVCVKTLRKQISRFLTFYEAHKNTEFKQDYREYNTHTANSSLCDVCGFEQGEVIYGYCLCYHCFLEMFDGVLARETVSEF